MMPRWLKWTLAIVACVIVGRWTLNSAMALAGHPIMYPDLFRPWAVIVEMALAAGVLWAVARYKGRKHLGFDGPAPYNVRLSLQWSYVFLALGGFLYSICSLFVLGAVATGVVPEWLLGLPNEPPTPAVHVLLSIHAGWVEEILVVGLLFFLFREVPWRINGIAFALTGWATAISVAIRVSYHTYQGIWVLPMIATGWAVVRIYRITGTIIPLIVAHIVWDLCGLLVDSRIILFALAVCVLLATELLTKGSSENALVGLRFRHSRKPPEFCWAAWRWHTPPVSPLSSPVPPPRVDSRTEHVGMPTPDA